MFQITVVFHDTVLLSQYKKNTPGLLMIGKRALIAFRLTSSVLDSTSFRVVPTSFRPFSTKSGRRVPPRKPIKKAIVSIEDAWTEVKDESSGQSYWWNQETNETTQLGALKPTRASVNSAAIPPPPAQEQSGGVMSGLGQTVVQGMAFGAGSSIAHHAIGSIFDAFSD